jgi:hypothetical protein
MSFTATRSVLEGFRRPRREDQIIEIQSLKKDIVE